MKIIKNIGFIFIQFIVCGIILEIFCYFFLLNSHNPLYRARRILQYDSTLGWMQKPNLDTSFEKKIVVTDSNGFRLQSKETQPLTSGKAMLTLGPSSAFGWGVSSEETYSSAVAMHFGARNINSSGVGHSIVQGDLIWKNIFSHESNLSYVLISYGVNELDKFRFFDSTPVDDKIFFKSEPVGLKIDKLHLPSNFIAALSLMIREVFSRVNCDHLVNSVQRVSWNDYEATLSKMLSEMKNKNITVVLINTPFFLKNKNPKYSDHIIKSKYSEVARLAQEGHCIEAHEKWKIAMSYEPDNIFDQIILFNAMLRAYALRNGLIYIDAFHLLQTNVPEKNFVDPVHPSSLGHQKIANRIINSLDQ